MTNAKVAMMGAMQMANALEGIYQSFPEVVSQAKRFLDGLDPLTPEENERFIASLRVFADKLALWGSGAVDTSQKIRTMLGDSLKD